MRVKARIQCPYCEDKAKPVTGHFGEPRWQGWTRYGCGNAHYFAVPTHTVAERQRLQRAA